MNKLFYKLRIIIEEPSKLLYWVMNKTSVLWSDSLYLRVIFRLLMKQKLDLKNPITFNQKLQWLKLYNRRPEYTAMVDKIKVKQYVGSIIGEEYIIPTLAIWNNADEIVLDALPDKFVLKTNHSGGSMGVEICRNKDELNITKVKNKLNYSLKHHDSYRLFREWPYKNVERKILAEELLYDTSNPDAELHDYKFYCFGGKVGYILISNDRSLGNAKFNYFDKNFREFPFSQGGERYKGVIEKPVNFELMIDIAEKLAKDIPHVRVDLYDVNGKVYFGEMTFFDSSGLEKFTPDEWDRHWGDMINLPEKTI